MRYTRFVLLAYLARAMLVQESGVAMKFSGYSQEFRATCGNLSTYLRFLKRFAGIPALVRTTR